MKFNEYIKETRGEMKHVTWPSRRQSILYTVTVIIISVGVGVALGLLDRVFLMGVEKIIG